MSSYLIILTGATGGLGRTIAQTWVTAHGSSKVGSLHLILVGRSMEALTSQKEELLSLKKGLTNDTTGSDLVVSIVANVDLAKIEELDTHWQHIHATYQEGSYDKLYLILNAGSLGDLSKGMSDYTTQEIRSYMDMNVVSTMALTGHFLRAMEAWKDPKAKGYIINISSLLALKSFSHWGLYSVGKTARDRMMDTVSKEVEEKRIRTFSYSPGPLNNAMQATVRESLGDSEQKEVYRQMHQEGKLVEPKDTANKLLSLLLEDAFTSGSHVDYYD